MKIAIRNLLRRKLLTAFAILGIAPGVSIVVSLLSLSASMKHEITGLISRFPGDLVVHARDGHPLRGDSRVPLAIRHDLEALPEVETADPYIRANLVVTIYIEGIHDNDSMRRVAEQLPTIPFLPIIGTWADSAFRDHVHLMPGGREFSSPNANEVILGKNLVEQLRARMEQSLESDRASIVPARWRATLRNLIKQEPFPDLYIGTERFSVVGLNESGNLLTESAALVPFRTAQRVAKLAATDEVTAFAVRLAPNVSDDRGVDAILPVLARDLTVQPAAQMIGQITANLDRFETMLFGIGMVATTGGALGILIVMLTNVHERTREIGLLLSVGWSRAMILRTILIEGLIISTAGGVLGLALGVLWIRGLELWQRMTLVREFAPTVFVIGMAVAIGLGFFGALVPAWRASRLNPVDALRYE